MAINFKKTFRRKTIEISLFLEAVVSKHKSCNDSKLQVQWNIRQVKSYSSSSFLQMPQNNSSCERKIIPMQKEKEWEGGGVGEKNNFNLIREFF